MNSEAISAVSRTSRNKREPTREARVSLPTEASVWRAADHGWRQLYGSFPESGFSLEWHDFEIREPWQSARSFRTESLELCLNLSGQSSISSEGGIAVFEPATLAFYVAGKKPLRATREGGQHHRFVTVRFSQRFLRAELASCDGALHPLVEDFMGSCRGRPRIGEVRPLTATQEYQAGQLPHPPVPQAARGLWYRARVLELMASCFFERHEEELFCDRQKRLARERTERVTALLRKHLAEPLSLEALGREVGCSPFHLSRTFSREMGMSLPQYLRKLRMERAAELLRGGKYNVTEAALEVGYSSLSHFSQAFCQETGCCPGLYPLFRDRT